MTSPIVGLSTTTDDGRFWWAGLPPGERIPWDFRILGKDLQVFPECRFVERYKGAADPYAFYKGTRGQADVSINLRILNEDSCVWFAFPRAEKNSRWEPLDIDGQRIPHLPVVHSLWEARYAITRLADLWPIDSHRVVNYTQYQKFRR